MMVNLQHWIYNFNVEKKQTDTGKNVTVCQLRTLTRKKPKNKTVQHPYMLAVLVRSQQHPKLFTKRKTKNW